MSGSILRPHHVAAALRLSGDGVRAVARSRVPGGDEERL